MVGRNNKAVQKRSPTKQGELKYMYVCKPKLNGEGKRTFDNPADAVAYLERATGQPSFSKGRDKLIQRVEEWCWIQKLQIINEAET